MDRTASLFFLICGAFACSGSVGADGGDGASDSRGPDPVVGSWTFRGEVPDIVTITLTFNSDKTFDMVETVAPSISIGGPGPSTCVATDTDTYTGTYAEGFGNGASMLDLTFTGGTANGLSGCGADSPGTPMTAQSIEDYRQQGLVPATTNTYTITATTLVLTPAAQDAQSGGGLGDSPATFSKVPSQ